MPLHLGLSRFVIRIWPVQTHAFRGACVVDVGAEHIPSLTQVQHSVMSLSCPTLWCDSHAFCFRHRPYSPFEVFGGSLPAYRKFRCCTPPRLRMVGLVYRPPKRMVATAAAPQPVTSFELNLAEMPSGPHTSPARDYRIGQRFETGVSDAICLLDDIRTCRLASPTSIHVELTSAL